MGVPASPTIRRLAVVAALLALTDMAVAKPATAAPPKRPGTQRQRAVPGHRQKAAARPVDPAATHPFRSPATSWPAAGTATATVPAVAPNTAPNTAPATAAAKTGRGRAGKLPVSAARPAAAASAGQPAAAAATAVPARVKVQLMDQAAAGKAGVTGLLMRVSRADGQPAAGAVNLQVDYSGFRYAVGGDWASRLHLVQLPDCALTDTRCGARRTVLASHNDVKAGTVSADVPATATGTLLAVAATTSGGGGDFAATSLSPSATWQASTQTGSFSWSYPMEVPPSPTGDAPDLALGYDSSAIDGHTSATNNQVSWVGEGFDLWPGYIERRYVACSDDGVTPKNGDECWRDDNASMQLGGQSTELVKDATTGAWHPKSDDGSKVEHLTGATNGDNDGEYWRVTTADGTQYYFGLNHLPGWASGKKTSNSAWTEPVYGNNSGEPCHDSPGWCQQAWRWNLDYVVDPHGNAETYWYTAETNYYARNQTSTSSGTSTVYTRGGTLDEADYSQRSDTLYSATAPDRVLFRTSERCIPDAAFDCAASKFTKANADHWPDVPFDANCDSGKTCTYGSPTFWSRKRLTSVVTQVLKGSSYQDVDTWTLTQAFPATGDGTSPEMWLSAISRAGNVGGTVTVPDVTFAGIQLTNRVDTTEGLPPITRWRISSITSETGGEISVSYSPTECVAGQTPAVDSNTERCFPGYWTPDGATAPKLDWFHKYLVTQVQNLDLTGGAPADVTSYDYLDTPAWHHDDDVLTPAKYKTWGEWKGYSKVRVTHGTATDPVRSRTDYLYFRGMNGDATAAGGTKSVSVTDSQGTTLPDNDPMEGFAREQVTGDGSTTAEDVIDDAWVNQTGTATRLGATVASTYVRTVRTRTTDALAAGGTRTTEVDTSYDSAGQPVQVEDRGDVASAADDLCTRISYVRNPATGMVDFASREEKVDVPCSATPNRPADVVSDVRTSYDGQAYGAAPTKGDVTRIERLAAYSGGTPVYVTDTVRGYDALGRIHTEADAAGNTTTTTYTPATGPPTQSVVTDPLGHTTTTTLEPAWGVPLAETDANGKLTSLGYDALGRLTGVWLPGRDKGTQSANTTYSYLLRGDGATAVGTSTLRADGTYTTSYDLLDALLRPRQNQDPAPGGGRVITDMSYDSRGQKVKDDDDYYADGDPSADLYVPNSDADIPGQTITSYDALERPTAEVFRVHGQEKWRTTYAYRGDDTVDITPPAGGTAVTKITDSRDRLVELRQYHGGTPTGAYDTTKYTWTPTNELATVTDPAGNVHRDSYDLRNRKISAQDPDSGTVTYTYNDLDQLTSTTDATGATLAYSYDPLGRKTGEYLGSTSGTKLAEWTYDTLAKGYPTAATRYVNGQAYTQAVTGYDDQYRATGNSVTIPAAEGFLAGTYTYSQDFNVDGTQHRDAFPAAGGLPAETLLHGYDDLGNPTTLHGATEYVSGTTYSKVGQVLQETMPANQHQWTRTNTYEDGTQRLLRTQDTRDTAPYTLSDRSYSYDSIGDITRIADAATSDTQCFRYDYLQRLTDAWTATDGCATAPSTTVLGGPAAYWQTFGYNAVGDRTKEVDHATSAGGADVTHTYSYPTAGSPQPHTVRSVTTTGGPDSGKTDTFGYNAAGETTARDLSTGTAAGAQALAWDAEGHLASATVNGQTSSYLYDAGGDLLIRHDPTGATLYLPDQQVHADNNGALTGERYYRHGDDTVALRTNAGLFWLLDDPQGTSTVAVDTASQAVSRRYYTPFGQTRGSPAGTFPASRGFVGGTTDPVTGLEHLGAREYDTTLGRFLSPDPIRVTTEPQQLEGYAYAGNNPVTYSDPSGECFIICWHKAARWTYHRIIRPAWHIFTHHILRPLWHLNTWIFHHVLSFLRGFGHVIHRVVHAVRSGLHWLGRHNPIRLHVRHHTREPEKRRHEPSPSASPSPTEERRFTPNYPLWIGGGGMPKPHWKEGDDYKLKDGKVVPFAVGKDGQLMGFSTFADPKQAAASTNQTWYYKIPANTPIPPNLRIYWTHDGPNLAPHLSSHHTFYPTEPEDEKTLYNAFVTWVKAASSERVRKDKMPQ
ncbi:MAG: RHS repeat-associated core domain-containing protein [Mycobacteriales bacterium]